MYVPTKKIVLRRPRGGLGDTSILDIMCSNLGIGCPTQPGSPEDTSTGPVVQVSNDAGQTSPIPSSSPGGGIATISTTAFVSSGGICKPTNQSALDSFKALQRQCNRVADAKALTKIAVDGTVGPATLALLTQIKAVARASGAAGQYNFLANQDLSSCSIVANIADTISAYVGQMANDLGASSSVSSPAPASPPVIVNSAGVEMPQGTSADLMDAFKNLSTPVQIGAVLALGGAAYFVHKSSRKKRR